MKRGIARFLTVLSAVLLPYAAVGQQSSSDSGPRRADPLTIASTLYLRNAKAGLNGNTDPVIYSDKTFNLAQAIRGQAVKNADIVTRFTGSDAVANLSLNGLHAINRYGARGAGGGDFANGIALGGYSEHYGSTSVTGSMYGGELATTIYGSGATIANAFGSLNTAQVGTAGSSTVDYLRGSQSLARIDSQAYGMVTNAYGVEGVAGIWSGGKGSITTAVGGRFWVNRQAGTITNAYGVIVPSFSNSGGKVAYGLYIDGPTGASTTNQALRVNSGTSYLAGGVALGDTISVAKKAVIGDSLRVEKGISVGGGPWFSTVLADSMSRDFDLRSVPYQDLTLTVRGAQPGDIVALGVPASAQVADIQYTAFVSSPNTITIRATRIRNAPDPAPGMFKVAVLRL